MSMAQIEIINAIFWSMPLLIGSGMALAIISRRYRRQLRLVVLGG